MRTITLELPDAILESYEEDMDVIKKEMNRGFVIWGIPERSSIAGGMREHFGNRIPGLSGVALEQRNPR
jgi:hypothetical protein